MTKYVRTASGLILNISILGELAGVLVTQIGTTQKTQRTTTAENGRIKTMISREEARLILYDMYNSCIDGYTNLLAEDKEVPVMLIDDINALDMAIEALSNERPKGRWVEETIMVGNPFDPQTAIEVKVVVCTECGTAFLEREKYCRVCGADMRGEEE